MQRQKEVDKCSRCKMVQKHGREKPQCLAAHVRDEGERGVRSHCPVSDLYAGTLDEDPFAAGVGGKNYRVSFKPVGLSAFAPSRGKCPKRGWIKECAAWRGSLVWRLTFVGHMCPARCIRLCEVEETAQRGYNGEGGGSQRPAPGTLVPDGWGEKPAPADARPPARDMGRKPAQKPRKPSGIWRRKGSWENSAKRTGSEDLVMVVLLPSVMTG